jgi:hypothetical protein
VSMSLSAAEIEEKAIKLAQERDYPMELATVVGMR